jgi:hypothetical protein
MYRVVRVGIPIQSKFVDNKFLEVVKNILTDEGCIGITTSDYPLDGMSNMDSISSPAGHAVLRKSLSFIRYSGELKSKVINTIGFVWDTSNRNMKTISECILNLISKEHSKRAFHTVYLFTPGSPLCGDYITEHLSSITNLEIIDTPSSEQISLNKMREYLGDVDYEFRRFHHYFLDPWKRYTPEQSLINKQIDPSKLNIFNCLSDSYNIDDTPILVRFLEEISSTLNDDDVFLVTTINENETDLMVLTIKEAKHRISEFRFSKKPFTVGIIRKGNYQ